MASGKGRMLDFMGSWVLSEAEVQQIEPLGDHFVYLEVQGQPSVSYLPGTKLQIVLPSRDVRTFTPIGGERGRFELLAYRHGVNTPAMRWLADLQVGDVLRFLGPQRSLSLPEGALTFIGDETAIAVAAAYRRARPSEFQVILEIEDGLDIQPVLDRMGLQGAVVVRRSSQTDPALLDAVEPKAQVGMAGSGEMVQRIRAQLRDRGVSSFKIKTYWIKGREGLD